MFSVLQAMAKREFQPMLPKLQIVPEDPGRPPEEVPYTPAMRLLLEIAYDGSEYAGWQIQPHCSSVQGVLQEEFTRLYSGTPIHLIGASRTDAGVHAMGFAASFLSPARPFIPPERIPAIINNKLPPAIRVMSIRETDIAFHTRYDAVGKSYTYVLNLGAETPFDARYSWRSRRELDVEAMMAASRNGGEGGAPGFNIYLDGKQITAVVEKNQKERGVQFMGTQVYSY